jgi:membrane protein YqaA with SNARE-associated domain
MIYLSLFVSAFVSATLWPMGSEALLLYDAAQGYPASWLLIVATTGNVLGAVVNYYLGLGGEELLEARRLIRPGALTPVRRYFDRFGAVTLLLSWLPIVGDLFTFVAGVVRYPFGRFVIWVTVAKAGRYALLLWGAGLWLYNHGGGAG